MMDNVNEIAKKDGEFTVTNEYVIELSNVKGNWPRNKKWSCT